MNAKRSLTVLVLPPGGRSSWSLSLPLRALVAGAAVWTALTLWAGASAMRRADYWAMKADNTLMHERMVRLVEEMERSRAELDSASQADSQLRQLLGMPSRRAILDASIAKSTATLSRDDGAGGPSPEDRATLLRELAHQRLQSFNEIVSYIDLARSKDRATPEGWPAQGRITSPFGYRVSPMDDERGEFHPGLDIANSRGTPIHATADGVVERAGWAGGYGRMVLIRDGYGYSILFGHAEALAVVVGQRIKRGDIVAYMGSTGRSTGNHVHYEVWKWGRPVNPASYLKVPD